MGMLNFTVLKSSADAKRYYSPHGHDYWIEDRDQRAFFGGKLAERLGLKEFSIEAFHELCEGVVPGSSAYDRKSGRRIPDSGDRLTPGGKENRRAGFDVTVDGPKDLGVLLALGMDDRIVPDVLERAGRDVMALIERDAKTRVRVGRQDTDRPTGEIVYTGVMHTTSRPVGDKIDIQPHFHFVVANVTWDPVEHRYKALQLQPWAANGAKEARPYYTAYFNAQLARYMQGAGYQIERTKDSFRVVGVPERVRKEFSQRTGKIEAVAAKLEEQKQAFLGDPTARLSDEVKGRLGAHTRERKQPGKTWEGLLGHWQSRLLPGEREAIDATVAGAMQGERVFEDKSRDAVDWALRHLLERKSVVTQRAVVTEALRHGLGDVTPEGVYEELGKRKDLIRRDVGGVAMCSTQGVLGEEKAITAFAVRGRGRYRPLRAARDGRVGELRAGAPAFGDALASNPLGHGQGGPVVRPVTIAAATPPDPATLSPSQQAAIRHVWHSRDRLILIRGAAGTGKTTLTRTALAGIDVPWVILAPSAEASRGVLVRDGFKDADTLARFLVDEKFQEKARNGLIWLDEASLAGASQLSDLVRVAEHLNARVILSGDRLQHKSVSRGDVLALLEDRAGLPVAVVGEIKRQSGEYKRAVESLARGDAAEGFAKLDALGWVREATHPGGVNEMVASDYLAAVRDGKSVLVVSPTHAEGESVTAAIREKLKQDGRLKGEEKVFERLVPLHLTEAEKGERSSLAEGAVAQFVRASGRFRAGDRVPVSRMGDLGRAVGGWAAYLPSAISLAAGDSIRLTANGKTLDGHRLNNGATYTVAGFTPNGDIRLNNGWTLGKDFGHLSHGYVTTSHGSQGKTVDIALVAMGNQSLPAMGSEQFYVSASRARQKTLVYVEDKSAVADAIRRDDTRMLASDLVRVPPKGIRDRLKSRVRFLRELGNGLSQRVTHLVKQPERSVDYERQ